MNPGRRRVVSIVGVRIVFGAPLAVAFGHWGTTQPVLDPNVNSEAQRLYGTAIRVYNADLHEWSAVFSQYPVFAVVNLTRHPVEVHFMAWSGTLHRGYDVTTQWALLVPDFPADSSARAIQHARAFAEAANPEFQDHRHVVTAADAARLGYPVSDPVAVSTLGGGFDVTLFTWADENGVVSEWKTGFAAGVLAKGEWTVRALQRGETTKSWEAAPLLLGTHLVNTYAGVHQLAAEQITGQGNVQMQVRDAVLQLNYQTVVSKSNWDTSRWDASFPNTANATLAHFAQNLSASGAAAYRYFVGNSLCTASTNPNASWGFRSRDPNCVLELRIIPATGLLCAACVLSGNQTVLYVREDFISWTRDVVAWYNDGTTYTTTDYAWLAVSHLLEVALTATAPSKLPDVFPAPLPGSYTRSDRSIDAEHAALRMVLDPGFYWADQNIRSRPNVTTVYPNMSGVPRLHVEYTGGPPTFSVAGLPRGWSVTVTASSAWTPDISWPNGTVFESTDLPVTEWDAVRPGTRLAKGCTVGAIVEGGGKIYATTVGHCFVSTQESTVDKRSLGNYTNYRDKVVGLPVNACVQDCALSSNVAAKVCRDFPQAPCYAFGRYGTIGTVAYANFQDVAEDDFGLIELASGVRYDPAVAFWNGPEYDECVVTSYEIRVDTEVPLTVAQAFAPMVFFGNGDGIGSTAVTKARAGFATSICRAQVEALAPAITGDSGSLFVAAYAAADGTLTAKYALGTFSGIRSPGGGPLWATTLPHSFSYLVSNDLHIALSLKCPGGPCR